MQVLGVPWVQLPGQQNILVQVIFNESDYAIRITDLQNIWGEDMNRKAIQARAKEIDCPIDAESNLVDLLKRLQDALTVDSTFTSILLKRRHDKLTVTTTEKIGSTELEWPFRLTTLPFSAVAAGLTLSLFSMMSFYQREIQSLLEIIEDKDTVIRQMYEFAKSANLVFKPNRRQKAFNKFKKAEWLDSCRSKASSNPKSSQEVVDSLSLVGRDANFRRDWRAVLSRVGDWDIHFLPETTERTPAKLPTSISKTRESHTPFGHKPKLARDDTSAQNNSFLSPTTTRIREKSKIPTKWSSPVQSSHKSSDINGADDDLDAKVTPRIREDRESRSASPTVKRATYAGEKTGDDLSLPIYKLKDNRESQQLEEDIDLDDDSNDADSIPHPPNFELRREIASDDTTDESDEELDDGIAARNKTTTIDVIHNKGRNKVSPLPTQDSSKSLEPDSDSSSSQKSLTQELHGNKGKRGMVKNIISSQSSQHSTPSKSRVLNVISPHKQRKHSPDANHEPTKVEVVSSPPAIEQDSQIIDAEAERRRKALAKRKEAAAIVKGPAKRTRKF